MAFISVCLTGLQMNMPSVKAATEGTLEVTVLFILFFVHF